jgi:serine/threonine-protein kinase
VSLDDDIAALVHAGRNEEAARIARDAGQPARAAELYAAVWKYADAIACARAAGALAEAYRYAIAARDGDAIAALLEEITAIPTEARLAVSVAEDRGRPLDAARFARSLGELDEAAVLYERAGELVLAAECRLALGDARGSGMLYERRLREAPDDASAGIALARILISLGRHDHAARALSAVTRIADAADEDLRIADRLLVACFAALGMNDAAADVLERLRAIDPSVASTVPEMLRATFGDARGLVADAQRDLVLGRYRVLASLGEGTNGRVLRAHDTFYARDVAIKALRAGGGAAGRDALARFAREAKVAMGIDHPNVVRVLAYHAEGPYLVMELMEGGTLEDRLGPLDAPKGPLAPSAALAIARAMLRALEAVHRRGVVHRDLKPANVLFSAAGEAKLGDFGVAHLVDLGATMTGAMMGSLSTMAPEQIRGGAAPDASTDLYAVGIVLFRMLTGRMPFDGADLATAHLDEPPKAATAFAPWLDARVDAVLASLLAKEPRERPSGAPDVLPILEALPAATYDEVFAKGAQPIVPRRASTVPPSAVSLDRYANVSASLDGTSMAHDTLLDRDVELRASIDADHLRAWGRIASPYVQAVCALDAETAVLERFVLARSAPRRSDLVRALAAIHAAGLVHGAIDARNVLVTTSRTLLRVPLERTSATVDDDLRALDRIAP